MINAFLPKQLQSFDYYVKKLPLYLRQSEAFVEHYRIWYDILVGELESKTDYNNAGVAGFGNAIFHLLNIFDQKLSGSEIENTYLEELVKFDDAGETEQVKYGTTSDILDKLGALVGVRRRFSVKYASTEKMLNLSNEDFLILIKSQIVKNYFDGSAKQLKEYYESVGLPILCLTDGDQVAAAVVYLDTSFGQISEDVEAMFLAGLLTIKSMGISYSHSVIALQNMLLWDTTNAWEEGVWSA